VLTIPPSLPIFRRTLYSMGWQNTLIIGCHLVFPIFMVSYDGKCALAITSLDGPICRSSTSRTEILSFSPFSFFFFLNLPFLFYKCLTVWSLTMFVSPTIFPLMVPVRPFLAPGDEPLFSFLFSPYTTLFVLAFALQ